MAWTTPDVLDATTITFDSSFLANLLSIDVSGITREPLETTTVATTGGQTFGYADTYDPGTVTCEIQFDATDMPGIATAVDASFDIDWGGEGVGATWSASAFLSDFSISGAVGEMVTATAVLKLTGSISVA